MNWNDGIERKRPTAPMRNLNGKGIPLLLRDRIAPSAWVFLKVWNQVLIKQSTIESLESQSW